MVGPEGSAQQTEQPNYSPQNPTDTLQERWVTYAKSIYKSLYPIIRWLTHKQKLSHLLWRQTLCINLNQFRNNLVRNWINHMCFFMVEKYVWTWPPNLFDSYISYGLMMHHKCTFDMSYEEDHHVYIFLYQNHNLLVVYCYICMCSSYLQVG